jgi:hypothetical protein
VDDIELFTEEVEASKILENSIDFKSCDVETSKLNNFDIENFSAKLTDRQGSKLFGKLQLVPYKISSPEYDVKLNLLTQN